MSTYSYEIDVLTTCLSYLSGSSNSAPLLEMIYVLGSSQNSRDIINEIKKRIPDFDKKVAENNLSREEKNIIAGFLKYIIEGYKTEKITVDRKDNEAIEVVRAFNKDVPEVSGSVRITRQEEFINTLVSNWVKQSKAHGATINEKETEQQIKKRVSKLEQSGFYASPKDIIRVASEEFARVDNSFNLASTPELPKETTQKYYEAYRSARLRTELTQRLTDDVPLTVPKDLYVAALASTNPESRFLKEEAEAVARASLASSDLYAGKIAPLVFWNNPSLKKLSQPFEKTEAIRSVVKNNITALINDDGLLTQLGVQSSPLISILQGYAKQSQQLTSKEGVSSAVNGLSKMVNEVVGSVAYGAPEIKEGYGTFMMIRGMTLLKGKYTSPWMSFLAESSSPADIKAQEAIFGFWLLTTSKENVEDFKKRVSPGGNLRSLFETYKDRSEFFKKMIENTESSISEVTSSRSLKTIFSMYFTQLYSVQGESRFTSLTGLEFFKTAFRIATGRPKQAELAFLMKTAGATVGKSALSRLAILSKAIPGPVGWLALGLGAVSGLLKGLFGGGQKGKTSEDIYKIIFVVIGIIALLFATGFTNSPQQNFTGQLVDSLGGASSLVQPGFAPCQGDACLWPLVQACGCLTQGVGGTYSHRTTSGQLYNAIDIGFSGCSSLSPQIRPTHSGFVSRVQNSNTGYGLAVYVTDLSGRYQTIYAHLSSIAVAVGQQVTPETTLGLGGSTGNSDGPHLHYERRDGPPFRIGVGTSIMSTIPSSFAGYCPGYGVNGGI